MRKLLTLTSTLLLASAMPSVAASVSSVDCSSSEIAVTFDGSVATSDVTKLEIGKGDNPRKKYNLDIVSTGAASGSTILKYTVSDAALTDMGKVSPNKAYIFVTGNSSGSAKCN